MNLLILSLGILSLLGAPLFAHRTTPVTPAGAGTSVFPANGGVAASDNVSPRSSSPPFGPHAAFGDPRVTGGVPESAFNGGQPAPMGIGDIGGPNGGQPSSFTSTYVQGTVTVGRVAAQNLSLSTPHDLSLQLNAFLVFDVGSSRYAYWTQDVAILNTATRTVGFEDNVWNATSLALASGALSGNGTVAVVGSSSYYGYGAPCSLSGACMILPNPQSLTLGLNATLGPGGIPTVRVLFADGGPTQPYDTVTFPWATSVSNFRGFDVDPGLGLPGNCPRCFGDLELIAGGPGNGSQTALDGATNLLFSLEWWNGYNFEPVPNAENHGEATEEGISNVVETEVAGATGQPEASIVYGTTSSPLGTLWTQTSLSTVEVSVVTGSSGGELTVGSSPIPFRSDFVETLVVPGAVDASILSGATTYPIGTISLAPGQVLSLEVGALPAVFVPSGLPLGTVWSVTLESQQLFGTGNITFGEAAGIYSYVIGSPSGYAGTPDQGNVSVSGSGTDQVIQFASTQHSAWSEFLGFLFTYELYVILAVIALAVIVVVGTVLSHRGPSGGR